MSDFFLDFVFSDGSGVTWDPANKSSTVTLSNGNLTATSTSGSWVYGTVSHSTGKRYYECESSNHSSGTNSPSMGAASSTVYLGSGSIWYGATDGGCMFPGTDGISPLHAYSNNGGPVNLNVGNFVNGSVAGIYVDFTAGKIWFARDGSVANGGNPAAGTGETLTFTPGTTLFPMTRSGASGTVVTARFNAATWSYSSAGFVEW